MSQPQLGQRIRALRAAKGYTIAQVATLSNLSKSFISMLENGHTNISATRLESLASLFGLRASDLLPDASTASLVHVVRAGQGPAIKGFGGDTKAQLLTKDLHRRIQPVLLRLAPGAAHENTVGHAGEEFIYILGGIVALEVDTDPAVVLERGDSAYYPSSLSHRYTNPAEDEAVLLTISTPPRLI